MDVEFQLPINREDLMDATEGYCVHTVAVDTSSGDCVSDMLEELTRQIKQEGALAITDNIVFDTLYSVTQVFSQLDQSSKRQYWAILLAIIQGLCNEMATIAGNGASSANNEDEDEDDASESNSTQALSARDTTRVRNALKMVMFLTNWALVTAEQDASAEATSSAASAGTSYAAAAQDDVPPPKSGKESKKAGGKKSAAKAKASQFDWDTIKDEVLIAISNMIGMEVSRFWHRGCVEEEFINLFSRSVSQLMESSDNFKRKQTKDAMFQVVGTLVQHYKHGLGFCASVIHMLPHFEHLPAHLADLVLLLAESYDSSKIVGDLLREIARINPADLARDASGTKSFAAFLVELSERVPEHILPCVSVLLAHLDGESYTMRNAVLSVLGNIVVRVLGQNKTDSVRHKRDNFLDVLEERAMDVHAFVRSKTMQVWTYLCESKAIPLSRQRHIVMMATSRLQDKSSAVRKAALSLLTAMLKFNPFGSSLDQAGLERQRDEQRARLRELDPAADEQDEALATGSGEVDPAVALGLKENTAKASKKSKKAKRAARNKSKDGAGTSDSDASASEGEDASADEDDDLKLEAEADVDAAVSPSQDTAAPEMSSEEVLRIDAVNRQRLVVQYFRDALLFVEQVRHILSVVTQLLGSKIVSDVTESVDLLVTAFSFRVDGTDVAVRRMLALVWSKEKSVKDAVVEAYRELFIPTEIEASGNKTAAAASAAKNLIELTQGATLGDLTSLEEMVLLLVQSGAISSLTMRVLWDVFANRVPSTTPAQSRGALIILGMAGRADPAMIRANLSLIVTIGLGERGRADLLLARDACVALQTLALISHADLANASSKATGANKADAPKPAATSSGNSREPVKFAASHPLFESLGSLLVAPTTAAQVNDWLTAAEQAVNTIYRLGDNPDVICAAAIRTLAHRVLGDENADVSGVVAAATQVSASSSLNMTSLDAPHHEGDRGELCKLIFLVGHVAVKQLVHMESIESELKRRRAINGEKVKPASSWTDRRRSGILPSKNKAAASDDEETEDGEDAEGKTAKTAKAKAVGKKGKNNAAAAATAAAPAGESLEDELGVAAAAEDAESEFIHSLCEHHLISGNDSLLSKFGPVIVRLCRDTRRTAGDTRLRAAAVLALSKFMLVSADFCDRHLQLLFTVLKTATESMVRANIVIALGDLAFRFPNLIEPWTPHIYARLADQDVRVRKNTLMVLTHLILNDMIRVKGQISAMAICIIDEDRRIADLAKLFFHELAKKGNTIYNILPDIVSRLSAATGTASPLQPAVAPAASEPTEEESAASAAEAISDGHITEVAFKSIMEYLFSFIQKEKQSDSLLDKLCHRFTTTRDPRQWRDIAYCLSYLSLSEKGIRRLGELFGSFQDKLYDDRVFECMETLITKARKFCRVELKTVLDELQAKMEECHKSGQVDHCAAEMAVNASSKAGGASKLSESDVAEMLRERQQQAQAADEASKPAAEPAKRAPRKGKAPAAKKPAGKGKARAQYTGSDDSSDDDMDSLPADSENADMNTAQSKLSVAAASKARAQRAPRRKAVVSDSEDDDDLLLA
ncbi:condensin XCAP-D2 chain [Capsaspora owczarzaki ATCC 30864]|nr:condensin XCAP-D2 chain [Capsaspora owczarzaki ATCC 30864]|eukprot:XP_004345622.1 condensin XCAP-D2 chain [Capsaspora owczarzaki ATCC 30864]